LNGSALFNPLVCRDSPPVAFVRTDNSGRPIAAASRADSLSLSSLEKRRRAVKCLHALSSFQRTDCCTNVCSSNRASVTLRRRFLGTRAAYAAALLAARSHRPGLARRARR